MPQVIEVTDAEGSSAAYVPLSNCSARTGLPELSSGERASVEE
jgi:hypothetical protein